MLFIAGGIPNTSSMLERAIMAAVEAHACQQDKAGRPHIFHPLAVMLDSSLGNEIEWCVAVLHDVLEDCPDWSEATLRQRGMSTIVIEAVLALTRQPAETYEAYLQRVKVNPVALKVKQADVRHNSERLDHLSEGEEKRLRMKYAEARRLLGMAH